MAAVSAEEANHLLAVLRAGVGQRARHQRLARAFHQQSEAAEIQEFGHHERQSSTATEHAGESWRLTGRPKEENAARRCDREPREQLRKDDTGQ